jgi:hypothetical protein
VEGLRPKNQSGSRRPPCVQVQEWMIQVAYVHERYLYGGVVRLREECQVIFLSADVHMMISCCDAGLQRLKNISFVSGVCIPDVISSKVATCVCHKY